jgi:hypothetical protein
MLPVEAPLGTAVTIAVVFQLVTEAVVLPNFTEPCVVPKLVPLIVTDALTAPEVEDRLVIVGVARTVNGLLGLSPATLTVTFPLTAPAGTVTPMLLALQLVTVAFTLFANLTVLEPCDEPKFVPAIVTAAPPAAEFGVMLVTVGVGSTVNDDVLLLTPLTFIRTLPVVVDGTVATMLVALQFVTVAATLLNLIVLVP